MLEPAAQAYHGQAQQILERVGEMPELSAHELQKLNERVRLRQDQIGYRNLESWPLAAM